MIGVSDQSMRKLNRYDEMSAICVSKQPWLWLSPHYWTACARQAHWGRPDERFLQVL